MALGQVVRIKDDSHGWFASEYRVAVGRIISVGCITGSVLVRWVSTIHPRPWTSLVAIKHIEPIGPMLSDDENEEAAA